MQSTIQGNINVGFIQCEQQQVSNEHTVESADDQIKERSIRKKAGGTEDMGSFLDVVGQQAHIKRKKYSF